MSAREVEMAIGLHLSWLPRGELSLEGRFAVPSIRGMSLMGGGRKSVCLQKSAGQWKWG